MAEPIMAPAAAPATTPAAMPQPRQCASTGDGNAAATKATAASATILRFMGVSSGQSSWRRSCTQQSYPDLTRLWADEPRPAPADEVSVAVMQRPTGPITAGAGRRIRRAIAVVHHVAGRRCIARLAVGDCAADDGAGGKTADHAANHAAAATRFRRLRCGERARCDGRSSGESQDRLLHLKPSWSLDSRGRTKWVNPKPDPDLVKGTDLICRKFVGAGRATPPRQKPGFRYENRAFPVQNIDGARLAAHTNAMPAPGKAIPVALARPVAARPVIGRSRPVISGTVIIGAVSRSGADDGAGSKAADNACGDGAATGFGGLRGGNRGNGKRRGDRDGGKGLGHDLPLFLHSVVSDERPRGCFPAMSAQGKRLVWGGGSAISRECAVNARFGNVMQDTKHALNFGQFRHGEAGGKAVPAVAPGRPPCPSVGNSGSRGKVASCRNTLGTTSICARRTRKRLRNGSSAYSRPKSFAAPSPASRASTSSSVAPISFWPR